MNVEEKVPYRWHMAGYLFLIGLFFGFSIAIMPPLIPFIEEDIALSHAQVGMIWGAAALGLLLFSLIGGNAGDRFGVKRVTVIALPFVAVVGGLRAFCDSSSALFLVMFLLGVAGAFIVPNLAKTVGLWFGPSELAKASGIVLIGGTIGSGIGMTMAASVLEPWLGGWRNVMLFAAALSLLVWVIWAVLAREREPSGLMAELARHRPGLREGMAKVFRVRDFCLLCIADIIAVGIITAVGGHFPDILVDKGMTVGMAGIFVGMSTWASLMGMFVGPYFSDRVGLRKIFLWPVLFANIPIVVLLGFTMAAPLLILILISGLLSGVARPMPRVLILENERIGPLLAGTAFGALATVGGIGAALLPALMGMVMDATGELWSGFVFLGVLAIIPALVILPIRETGRRARAALAEASSE